MSKRKISRRSFIGQASCAAIGTMPFLSTALNLGMINTLSARPHIISNTGDYKAMVCILLAGGIDSFNVLVPTNDDDYTHYQNTRGSLALDRDATDPAQLLELNYSNTDGKEFSVHGGMDKVRDLFNDGDLSFVANIGTLIEPIANQTEYYNKQRPLGLYSHNDQIMQWQTSVPQSRSAVGVGGRMADILHDMNTIDEISMNISLSGKNRFQTGNEIIEYSINRNTDETNIGYTRYSASRSNSGALNYMRDQAITSMAEQEYADIFSQTMGSLTSQTNSSIEIFRSALSRLQPMNTVFSDTNLSEDLKKIAETISIRQHLGANRQIFFVTLGGWDHHDNVIQQQELMLPMVSNALHEFKLALEEIGMYDDVVTFTISDFSRTLTSNGNGSDHAWGGNQMIMGGPINGGQIFGNYPSLDIDNNDLNLSNRGRFIPTTSVDEFYAELALWFGVSPNDLDYILPNLCNFYSGDCNTIGTNYAPVGMFNSI